MKTAPSFALLALLAVPGFAQPNNGDDADAPPLTWIEPVPGLRVNPSARVVEFEGEVAVQVDRSGELMDYIELFVCSWDSREHESLVVTSIKPSELHAALLVAGAIPGRPAEFRGLEIADADPERSPPTGTPLEVTFNWTEGAAPRSAAPWSWLVHTETAEKPIPPTPAFVFAGSDRSQGRYPADGEGAVIPLVVFHRAIDDQTSRGVGTVAWSTPISHEASVDEPVWIADRKTVPDASTPIVVRISVLDGFPTEPSTPYAKRRGDQPAVPVPQPDLDGLTDEE